MTSEIFDLETEREAERTIRHLLTLIQVSGWEWRKKYNHLRRVVRKEGWGEFDIQCVELLQAYNISQEKFISLTARFS